MENIWLGLNLKFHFPFFFLHIFIVPILLLFKQNIKKHLNYVSFFGSSKLYLISKKIKGKYDEKKI